MFGFLCLHIKKKWLKLGKILYKDGLAEIDVYTKGQYRLVYVILEWVVVLTRKY